MVQITYWGKLADLTGTALEQCELPDTVRDTAGLRAWVDQRHGSGEFLNTANRVAVNDEIVVEPAPVSSGDEVAFLPPVGGG